MIPMTIYVSNLSFTMTDDQLKKVFVPFGEVSSARIMTDKFTNRSRGFAFIEMPDEQDAQKAINDLNGSSCDGRQMVVNMAKPKQQF
jgi:RNA recognition motif-containing protein